MPEIDPDTMATPWRRDPSETAPALQRWVEHTIGAGAVVSDVGEPGNGMSSETALFTVTHPDHNFIAEMWPDEGDIDFVKVLKVYREVGYEDLLMPDHAPAVPGQPEASRENFPFGFGYIRGLIEAERHII